MSDYLRLVFLLVLAIFLSRFLRCLSILVIEPVADVFGSFINLDRLRAWFSMMNLWVLVIPRDLSSDSRVGSFGSFISFCKLHVCV